MRSEETVTQALHRLTSFPPGCDWNDPIDVSADGRMVQDLEILEFDRIPWPYKRYEQALPRRALPVGLPTTTASALSVLAGRARPPAADLGVDGGVRKATDEAGLQAGRGGKGEQLRQHGSRVPVEVPVAALPVLPSRPPGTPVTMIAGATPAGGGPTSSRACRSGSYQCTPVGRPPACGTAT